VGSDALFASALLEDGGAGEKSRSLLTGAHKLLILCVHGSKHRWRRITWICDVAEPIHAHRDPKGPQVIVQAVALGGEHMLLLGKRSLRYRTSGARFGKDQGVSGSERPTE
jgi:hypothetical protein